MTNDTHVPAVRPLRTSLRIEVHRRTPIIITISSVIFSDLTFYLKLAIPIGRGFAPVV
jgi:hypothetical protein